MSSRLSQTVWATLIVIASSSWAGGQSSSENRHAWTLDEARPINPADLAALAERVRRRVIRWFRLTRLLDAAAAADMLAWENSGFSVDAGVRITLVDRDVPRYFRSLEHLLRYCARPPFALERLSVIRGADGRITKVRYVLPRHKAANWVGPGRGRKSTRPGANGVVELTPFEFLERLADLVPPPRKHRHRYHGVFAPNHRLRKAVTALAIGNGPHPISKKKRPRCFSTTLTASSVSPSARHPIQARHTSR